MELKYTIDVSQLGQITDETIEQLTVQIGDMSSEQLFSMLDICCEHEHKMREIRVGKEKKDMELLLNADCYIYKSVTYGQTNECKYCNCKSGHGNRVQNIRYNEDKYKFHNPVCKCIFGCFSKSCPSCDDPVLYTYRPPKEWVKICCDENNITMTNNTVGYCELCWDCFSSKKIINGIFKHKAKIIKRKKKKNIILRHKRNHCVNNVAKLRQLVEMQLSIEKDKNGNPSGIYYRQEFADCFSNIYSEFKNVDLQTSKKMREERNSRTSRCVLSILRIYQKHEIKKTNIEFNKRIMKRHVRMFLSLLPDVFQINNNSIKFCCKSCLNNAMTYLPYLKDKFGTDIDILKVFE